MSDKKKKKVKAPANNFPTTTISVIYTPDGEVSSAEPKTTTYAEIFQFQSGKHATGGRLLDLTPGPQNIKWTCANPFAIVFMSRYCYTLFNVITGSPYLFWQSTDANPWAAVQSESPGTTGDDVVYLEAIDPDEGSTIELIYDFLPLYLPNTTTGPAAAEAQGGRRGNAHMTMRPHKHKNRLLRAVIRLAT